MTFPPHTENNKVHMYIQCLTSTQTHIEEYIIVIAHTCIHLLEYARTHTHM